DSRTRAAMSRSSAPANHFMRGLPLLQRFGLQLLGQRREFIQTQFRKLFARRFRLIEKTLADVNHADSLALCTAFKPAFKPALKLAFTPAFKPGFKLAF